MERYNRRQRTHMRLQPRFGQHSPSCWHRSCLRWHSGHVGASWHVPANPVIGLDESHTRPPQQSRGMSQPPPGSLHAGGRGWQVKPAVPGGVGRQSWRLQHRFSWPVQSWPPPMQFVPPGAHVPVVPPKGTTHSSPPQHSLLLVHSFSAGGLPSHWYCFTQTVRVGAGPGEERASSVLQHGRLRAASRRSLSVLLKFLLLPLGSQRSP